MTSISDAQPQPASGKFVHSIVLDTSPLLNNTPSISTLLAKCEKLYTVPAILDEVKDVNARSRLETMVLPFLTIKTPESESIKLVSDFSRRTGDYSVLSKPDIQVLALAYELECERNSGNWKLRKTPGQKGLSGSPPETNNAITQNPHTMESWLPDVQAPPSTKDSCVPEEPSVVTKDDAEPPTLSSAEELKANEVIQGLEGLLVTESKPDNIDPNSDHPGLSVFLTSKPINSESESDDSEGWITPSNLKKQQAKDDNASTASISGDQPMQVATITSDFAMQNVLLQIGLNLLSSSLQRVKNIRTYVLRCHACFEMVKDMSKQFCPRCGKPALTRVSCSTNLKGEFKIHLKKNMQWNHRGDRFSIPKLVPGAANGKVGRGRGGGKGGWGQELILAEDQKEYLRATNGRVGKKETDLMDDDFLPRILTGERARNGGRPKIGAGRNVNSKRRA